MKVKILKIFPRGMVNWQILATDNKGDKWTWVETEIQLMTAPYEVGQEVTKPKNATKSI